MAFHIKGFEKFVVCADIHGDQQDPSAVKAFFSFCESWKPDIKVLAGDLFDFRPIRKKASESERGESMDKDYESGAEFLETYRPHVFEIGNHDNRIFVLAEESRGPLQDHANRICGDITNLCGDIGCTMLPYHVRDGVFRLGSLKIIHGFYHGVTATRRTALAYGSTIFGHGHGIQHHAIEGLENRMGRMIGCLCSLNMKYLSTQIMSLAHRHGWCYGVVHRTTGLYHCWQAEKIGDTWLLPTNLEKF